MTIEHVQDEWASVPQADRMRAKWEAVGAAVEGADRDARGMLVARLENMQKNGDTWLTVQAVLALLNDCDMRATRVNGPNADVTGLGRNRSNDER